MANVPKWASKLGNQYYYIGKIGAIKENKIKAPIFWSSIKKSEYLHNTYLLVIENKSLQ